MYDFNNDVEVNPATLWECGKVVIRGKMIEIISRSKKKQKQQQQKSKKITELKKEYKNLKT